jgi:hypothetical protein
MWPILLAEIRLPLDEALLADLDRHLLAPRPTHVVCTHDLPALAAWARGRGSRPAPTTWARRDRIASPAR